MDIEWFLAFKDELFARFTNALKPFKYQVLPDASHFRVLALEPGYGDAHLSCKLEVVSVQTARQSGYEALSYAWGIHGDSLKSFILCHGNHLRLTSSLESALRHMRSEEKVIRLWADQICINQEDIHERSQQISLMRLIYSAAKRVVIWLGVQDDASHVAMTFAPVLYRGLCQHLQSQGTGSIQSDYYGKQLTGTDFIFPSFDSPNWLALNVLLRREWFQRVWVAQEATANSITTVCCGKDEISWDMLTELFHLLDTRTNTTRLLTNRGQASDSISFLQTLRAFTPGISDSSQDLLTVIKAFSEQLATDPRDRIFAVLGFVQDFKGVSVAPNYALDVKDVFLNLAFQCLMNDYGLELLYYANMTDDSAKKELPSWVPDWRHQPLERTVGSKMIRRSMFMAASSKKAVWGLDASGEKLTLRGRRICIVTDRGVLHPAKQYVSTFNREDPLLVKTFMYQGLIHEFYQKTAGMAKEVAGKGRSWEDILCSVLTRDYWEVSCGFSKALDIMRELQALASWSHALFEAYSALPRGSFMREHFLDFGDPTVDDWHNQHLGQTWPLLKVAKSLASNKEVVNQVFDQQRRGNRVVNTSMQMLANVPEITKEGDQIWIVYGCSTPFLLRPTERGYLMVGACFLDGVMNGQALTQNMGVEKDASLV
ncbi:MAG: hypothetical protein OHK93_002421 [Ramalina farinacea]|uniref:Heterokaryon incompatibility domain-containing protein n=1 Tax=Ramalina farinacea TaxID=258253 RepID=A0AA43QT42_9LECA|nr:hypothetical protein [Ramalina farinacea]